MGKVKLKVGDKAPLFKLDSFNAGTIDLSELIGQQKIAVIFSRYFGCPICQVDLTHLLKRQGEIEGKGAKILYITQSGEEIGKKFVEEKNISFPVIPSSKEELYAEYGLGMMGAGALTKLRSKLKEAKELGLEHGEYEGWENKDLGNLL